MKRKLSIGRRTPETHNVRPLLAAKLSALGQLPLQQRAVLVLRYFEDMSEAHIAEAMSISTGSVKNYAMKLSSVALPENMPDPPRFNAPATRSRNLPGKLRSHGPPNGLLPGKLRDLDGVWDGVWVCGEAEVPVNFRNMRPALSLLAVVLLAAAGCGDSGGGTTAPQTVVGPGDHSLSFVKANGVKQEFLLHAPKDFSSSKRYPLIVVYHGSPGTPSQMQAMTGFDDLADRKGFLVAYPELGRDGDTLRRLLDLLTAKWGVDAKHIHLAGFSAGASAVYGLAQTMTSRIGSVAPVSGTGGINEPNSSPISLITFQGEYDNQNWDIGNANWAKVAGCQPETVTQLTIEQGPVTRHAAECKGGAEFVYYQVRMGHIWPAGASELIWEFFAKHPLP